MHAEHGCADERALRENRLLEYKKAIEATGRQEQAAGFESPGKVTKMNVARKLSNWRKYRQTVAELGRLTPRELQDVGIDPTNIRGFARTVNGL